MHKMQNNKIYVDNNISPCCPEFLILYVTLWIMNSNCNICVFRAVLSFSAAALMFPVSCSSVELEEGSCPCPGVEEDAEAPSSYKEKERTAPYPKENNELYINPSPLIVPEAMKTGAGLQFELSLSPDFPSGETQASGTVEWNMFNPHRELEQGIWYWRFRSVDEGGAEGEWSMTYSFEVAGSTPVFVTPDYSVFRDNLPSGHPRLYCFLDDRIDEARENVSSHSEYRELNSRAKSALSVDYSSVEDLYGDTDMLKTHAMYLYHAYYLTQDSRYSAHLRSMLDAVMASPPSDKELFASNFDATNIALACIKAYDLLYATLDQAEKSAAEDVMMRVARKYYAAYCGSQENKMFDNHFWQQNYRVLFLIAYMLYDNPSYSSEVMPMLEYYYELWTARAPASGYNRDGMWHNGTGYFSANVKTLFLMPSLFSHITGTDFLAHPWYRNAGKAIIYSFPPASRTNGFGDQSEKYTEQRIVVAFEDFLAKETGDACAAWYAKTCAAELKKDYNLRLYRMCVPAGYEGTLPDGLEKMIWYRDIGEVAMHSNIGDTSDDLALCFRSGTYGSGSHTTSSQNAFNLLYKGENVYRSTGYYQNFSDAHNLMSYRHSRAHNTILINGIGQPYSTEAYGNVARAAGGDHISYCLGDASHAYRGISNDPMWVEAFEKAGIEQSPENGFGPTPLTRYRRHVLMLHPDIVVIYDELEASEPADWQWLLHSPTEFGISGNEFGSANAEAGFAARTTLFCSTGTDVSQTDQFVVPPARTGPEYPNQWHLTAEVDDVGAVRFLAVIQVADSEGELLKVSPQGDIYHIGGWQIRAVLDTSSAPLLEVSKAGETYMFSYGSSPVAVDGGTYCRSYASSSVLYDIIDGTFQVVEMTDELPVSTKSMLRTY